MEKPSFKLIGAPCGQHGQYTFYKALRVSGATPTDKVIAVGDFFFAKVWQDSELVSIGELQLLWTDRVSDQTLCSVRLYFLPENTPDGRNLHGEDEVLAINDKVVLKAEDLLTWLSPGSAWRCGLRAVWKGACAPTVPTGTPTQPLYHTKLDFSDVEKEKSLIPLDPDSPGVVVFSYPRYCRYRALAARLDGIKEDWLRDALVAALGGYAAETRNTAILYCRDTFEYPELESHEFLCNHLAPKLKGRPRGRRRRAARSRSRSRSREQDSRSRSRSSDSDKSEPREVREANKFQSPRRLSLRNGASERPSDDEHETEARAFLLQLKHFYKERGEAFSVTHALKDISLLHLYRGVCARGGYEAVCAARDWRALHPDRPARLRSLYERFLLPFENHERKLGKLSRPNGKVEPVDSITVPDSPQDSKDSKSELKDLNLTSKPAEELNREFLDSLPENKDNLACSNLRKLFEENTALANELSVKYNTDCERVIEEFKRRQLSGASERFLGEFSQRVNLGNPDQSPQQSTTQDLSTSTLSSLSSLTEKYAVNGTHNGPSADTNNRPAGRSSLRHVRVKPTRPLLSAGNTPPILRPDSASLSPPSNPPYTPTNVTPNTPGVQPVTNFGIHHPPAPSVRAQRRDSDDEIVEVPYKPKTPEIIDLDEYPESPQTAKKKKLEILKERGLEVTAIPPTPWGLTPTIPLINPPMMLNPAMQHQIMTQASLFQMYNIIPQNYANGIHPPKIIQSSCLYGNTGPEKTVYGNPKDPFMPPPHVLHGCVIQPNKIVETQKEPVVTRDCLDLTCKLTKPAVEIVKVPSIPSPSKAQNLTKNYSILDGKAVVGSNLEITLVSPKSPSPKRSQKRSSNGKFVSTKSTPPKDFNPKYTSPKASPTTKKPAINIPNYQIRDDSPSSTSSRESANIPRLPNLPNLPELPKQPLDPKMPMSPFVDPLYMMYSSLASMDQRQLAMYMASFRGYSGLLGVPGATPTTKN